MCLACAYTDDRSLDLALFPRGWEAPGDVSVSSLKDDRFHKSSSSWPPWLCGTAASLRLLKLAVACVLTSQFGSYDAQRFWQEDVIGVGEFLWGPGQKVLLLSWGKFCLTAQLWVWECCHEVKISILIQRLVLPTFILEFVGVSAERDCWQTLWIHLAVRMGEDGVTQNVFSGESLSERSVGLGWFCLFCLLCSIPFLIEYVYMSVSLSPN